MTTSCRPLLACHDSVISTFLLIVISVNVVTSQFLPFDGESISDRRYFPLNQSPFKINHDLIVTKTGQLIIEAGVEVQFSPRKGIYVEGALIAKGNENRKIVFTRLDSTASGAPNGNQHVISSTVQWPEARLVDGDLPSEGRLQLKLNDRWHSVCTNSRNWTKVDIDVLCKQIGFADGNWYNWFHRINDSRQLMFETPSCIGSERELQECSKWNMRQVGSGICDYHMDIGIRCSKRLVNSQQGFWSGIKFYNSKWRSSYSQVLSGRMRERSSDSVLEHVEVFYAGESSNGEATPAIESIGVPPVMSNIFVRWSASSAVNITNPGDGFKIVDSRIIENRGYGIFVNSSHGQVSLENVEVSSNGADGVRYAVREDLEVGEDFCRFASLGDNQVYPVRLTHEQNRYSQSRSRCCQEFKISNHVNRDAQLTVHFPYMMVIDFEGEEKDRKRVSDGIIEVQDGYQGTLVSKFVVRNDTKIPSVTSTQGRIRICYQPAILKKVLFTVVIVADNGRAYELNITRGDIRANNGRGVWITDQLTGSVVNHTVIANHSYVAGLHVASGCGNIIVNNSKIIDNAADGINITLSDGHRHIDRTTVSGNSGRGVALWFNESLPTSMEPSYAKPFVSQVTYSHIVSNGGVGVLMSNVCLSDSFVNISMNTFQGK
ncbi:Protein bark beetle [Halotydeus destructor]|nr:Protein bark beetle [Halotydeus destructor]